MTANTVAGGGVDDWDAHWVDYGDANERNPAQHYRRELALFLAGRFEEPSRLLDIGSGNGDLLAAAERRWPAARLAGLELSPLEMLEHGITRAGPLMIPSRPEMALEFLEVEYVTIQHYGVQVDTLRYNGEALNDFRNQRSTARGPHAGRWPVAVDSGDFSRIWF